VPDVRVCAGVRDLAYRAAEAGATIIKEAVRTRGRCSLVLSGGNFRATPPAMGVLVCGLVPDQCPCFGARTVRAGRRSTQQLQDGAEALLDHADSRRQCALNVDSLTHRNWPPWPTKPCCNSTDGIGRV
jgi:hypothetical protein